MIESRDYIYTHTYTRVSVRMYRPQPNSSPTGRDGPDLYTLCTAIIS